MTTMDYMAMAVMGVLAAISAVTFGMMANDLFDRGLADRLA